jgi:hypothetical protein
MRTRFVQTLLFILVSATASLTNAQEASSEATIEWLSEKLNNYTYRYAFSDDRRVTFVYRIFDFSIKNGVLSFRFPDSNRPNHWFSYSASLKNLSPSAKVSPIPAATNPPQFWLTVPSRRQGQVDYTNSYEARLTADAIQFNFADQELANRVAKAINHLIKLSGGREEPF